MGTSRTLRIEFCELSCIATDELTFGRRSELVLDAHNPYLHAEAGRLRLRDDDWFVYNTGSRLHLQVLHQTGFFVELPPSASARIPAGHGRIRVSAGGSNYEFDYFHADDGQTVFAGKETGTLFYGRDLTPAQIDYAVTMARYRLRGLRTPPPTQAEIAELWSVSLRAVNKTFEDIRQRLRSEGVHRVTAPEDLLEYLVLNRILTVEHLDDALLDSPEGPRRRSDILRERRQDVST